MLAPVALCIIGASVWLILLAGKSGPAQFYIAQGILLLSLLLLWIFRQQVVKPIATIANGMNLLREQDFSSRLAPVGQSDADTIVRMFNEMMDRLKRERLHIREQNHFLDLLIDESPMGVIVLGEDGRITMLNRAAATFLGTEAAAARLLPLDEVPGPLAHELAHLPQGHTRTLRLSNSRIYRCARLSYMDQGFRHPFLLVERLTDEVMRAERTAYEKVIRMMAHEVNNSMAGIGSILDTASYCIDDAEISDAISTCRRRCLSMSEFITSFADVVKIPLPTLTPIELNSFLQGSQKLLESICATRRISVDIVPASEPAHTKADPVLMEQVVINLVKNAAESIGTDGAITIRISSAPAGFSVEDNGPGIDEATQQKIFTPFFSSKASGRGLGLLFVSDVLNKHRCGFSLRTYPDGITRFCVSFPHKP